jgi:hypothetical protein
MPCPRLMSALLTGVLLRDHSRQQARPVSMSPCVCRACASQSLVAGLVIKPFRLGSTSLQFVHGNCISTVDYYLIPNYI